MTVSASDLTVLLLLLSAMCALFAIAGWIGNRLNLPDDHHHMQPPSHVTPTRTRIGRCHTCQTPGVIVHRYAESWTVDPSDTCRNCIADAEGVALESGVV